MPTDQAPSEVPIVIPNDRYYALRIALLERLVLQAQVAEATARSDARVDAAMTAAGLTVGANYALNDEACSATWQG